MSDQDNTSPNVMTVDADSAPATTEVSTEAVTTDSAPVSEVPATTNTEVEGSEPSKAVKELIVQRKRRQAAELEAANLRGQLEVLRQQNVKHEPTPTAKTEASPKLDDYETFDEYEQAKEEYVIAQAEKRVAARFQKQITESRQAEHQQTTFTRFIERIEEAAKDDPTILSILDDKTIPAPAHVAAIVQASEQAPELLRWLNNNRKEAARIAGMSPVMAARELGMIEAQIKFAPKAPPTKKVSQAPDPIPTVKPAGASVVDEDSLPLDEWIKRRNKAQFGR